MQLILKNETDHHLTVKLFPKEEFIKTENLYDYTDIDGGYLPMLFDLSPQEGIEILVTKKLELKPNALMRQVFDSINVEANDDFGVAIKFTPGMVNGYAENQFDASRIGHIV